MIITKPVTSHVIELLSLTTLPLWLIPNLGIILFSSLWYGEEFITSTLGIWALASLIAAPMNVFVLIVVTSWQSHRIERKLRVKARVLKLENVL